MVVKSKKVVKKKVTKLKSSKKKSIKAKLKTKSRINKKVSPMESISKKLKKLEVGKKFKINLEFSGSELRELLDITARETLMQQHLGIKNEVANNVLRKFIKEINELAGITKEEFNCALNDSINRLGISTPSNMDEYLNNNNSKYVH